MSSRTPEQNREYQARWYQNHRRIQIDRNLARKAAIRSWFIEFKNTLCCNRCGENHPATLDFHHVDDNKEHAVGSMVDKGFCKARILSEISKCLVLCANCHRKEHAK